MYKQTATRMRDTYNANCVSKHGSRRENALNILEKRQELISRAHFRESARRPSESSIIEFDEEAWVDKSRKIAFAGLGAKEIDEDAVDEDRVVYRGIDSVLGIRIHRDSSQILNVLQQQATYELKKGQPLRALTYIMKAKGMKPDNSQLLSLESRCLVDANHFKEALNVSEAILATNSDTAYKWMAMYVKAESLFNMCDFEHAMVFYSRAKELAPSAEKVMLKKKFDKTSVTISRVLKTVGMGYFICIHVMPQPVEPDKMKIEDSFDIFDWRNSLHCKRPRKNEDKYKPSVVYNVRPKRSYKMSAVAKSVRKREYSPPEVPVRKTIPKKIPERRNSDETFINYILEAMEDVQVGEVSKEVQTVRENAEDALDYVKNRKIFWAQQQTPIKIRKHIDKTETNKAKLIAIGTFIKESIPKPNKTGTTNQLNEEFAS